MKIIGRYAATMGSSQEGGRFHGIADIEETATTWRITFKPFGWEFPTAHNWIYKKRSKKEDGKTSSILPDFWKEYKSIYQR